MHDNDDTHHADTEVGYPHGREFLPLAALAFVLVLLVALVVRRCSEAPQPATFPTATAVTSLG